MSKSQTVTITFPLRVTADDYHEFHSHCLPKQLTELVGQAVKVEEAGFDCVEGIYIGVAYLSRNGVPKRFLNKLVNECHASDGEDDDCV